MIERLVSDQARIRARYNLPPRELRLSSPSEFERSLLEIAKQHKIRLRKKHEFGKFFQENPAGAFYDDETKQVVANSDRTSREKYVKSLGEMERELIHALQHLWSASMPIELREYEAYTAGGNMQFIKENPHMLEILFNDIIGGSVRWHYNHESKKKRETIKPDWDDVDYFLKLDARRKLPSS